MRAHKPIKLIYAVSSEKLHERIFSEIRDLQQTWPNERCNLLVPERLKLSYERRFLEYLAPEGGEAALLLAEVLSFNRFSLRVLDQGGRRRGAHLPQAHMVLILASILQSGGQDFRAFERLSAKSGFMQELARLIGDCRRYLATPADLRAVAGQLEATENPERSLIDRLYDLALLLERYEERLDDDVLEDAGQVIADAAELLQAADADDRRLNWLAGTHIYISGFGDTRDFTPQEYALLHALAERCRSITLAVVADREPAPNEPAELGARPFQSGRQTLVTVREHFPEVQVEALSTTFDPETYGVALAFAPQLATSRLREDPVAREVGEEPRYRLVYATNPETEVDLLAAKIQELTETGAARFRDIAVLPLDPAVYLPLLKASFRVYGIPAYLDTPQALAGSPLRSLVLGIVNLARFGWEPDLCWTLLRTGLFDLDMAETDILENACLARGIDRRSFWDDTRYIKDRSDAERGSALSGDGGGQPPLGSGRTVDAEEGADEVLASAEELDTDDETEREDRLLAWSEASAADLEQADAVDDGLLSLRDRAFAGLRVYIERLRQTQDVAERSRVLLQALEALEMEAQVRQAIAQLEALGDDGGAVGFAQGWNLLVDLLQLLQAEGGGLNYGLADYHSLLDHGIAASLRQAIPSRIDQILVGQAEEVAHFSHRHLFILGADRDKLPGFTAVRGLLSDVERELLDEALPHGFSQQEERLPAARYHLIWQYLTTPKHLTLMHSGGREQASQVMQLLAGQAQDLELLYPGGRLAGRFDIRYRADLDHKAQTSIRDLFESKRTLQLPSELVSELQSTPMTMSVSRLERYMACGYQYLQQDLLKIGERQIYTPQMNHIGTYLHKIYELFYQELTEELRPLTAQEMARHLTERQRELATGQLNPTVERLMRQAFLEEQELRVFDEPVYRGSAARKVRRLARATILATLAELREHASGYRPEHQEWTFGMQGQPGLYLEAAGGLAVNFRGQVDRIDVKPSEGGPTLYRIMDYKSGTKQVDYNRLWHGLDLQLPVYLEAVQTLLAEEQGWTAEDAMYYSLSLPTEQAAHQTHADQLRPDLHDTKQLQKPLSALKLEQEALTELRAHSLERAREGLDKLQEGHVPAVPRTVKARSPQLPCRYCPYSGICQIERAEGNYEELPTVREVWQTLHPDERAPTNRESLERLLGETQDRGGDA